MIEGGLGCRILLGIVMGMLLLSFALSGNCSFAQKLRGEDAVTPGEGIATINGEKVSEAVFDRIYTDSIQRYALQGMTTVPAFMQASIYNNAIEQAVISTMLRELCKREKVDLDADTIGKVVVEQTKQAFEAQKQQWITDKKLKPNATEADFNALYEKEYKQTPKSVIDQNTDPTRLNQLLEGPQGDEVRTVYANQCLIAHFRSQINATDDDIRQSKNVYVGKRIVLKPEKHPGVDLAKKLEGLKKEIESGKLKFEDAMNANTDEDAPKGKKKSDNTMEIDGTTASVNASYAPVVSLKPGGLAILNFPQSFELYRLDMIRSELPADYATNKATYISQYSETKAIDKMQKALEAMRKEKGLIQWHDEAYRALYEYAQFEANPDNFTLDPGSKKKAYEGFIDMAKSIGSAKLGQKVAAIVTYQAFEKIFAATPKPEQAALTDRRIEVLGNFATATESVDIMLEVVGLYAVAKDGAKVSEWIGLAIEAQEGKFDDTSGRSIGDIAKRVETEEKTGVLKKDQADALRAKLSDWRKAKVENDKYLAADKAAAAEQAKKDAAEEAKFKAEEAARLAKEKADADKKPKASK
ncbi:MAG: SurA N-terminal domain-containing protein [Fimbriimonadaceae bacterium]